MQLVSFLAVTAIACCIAIASRCHGAIIETETRDYARFQVIRIKIRSDADLKLVQNLEKAIPNADIWFDGAAVGEYTDVMVSPDDLPKLNTYIQGLEYKTFIGDVGKLIENQKDQTKLLRGDGGEGAEPTPTFFWTQYQRLDSIFDWIQSLETSYPNLVSSFDIGASYQGRPLRVLKISTGPGGNGTRKPSVFLDSGIHAREWISPATLTFILNQLATNATYADIRDGVDIYGLPVLNPDGYEYTHTTNRMWRKNRVPNSGSSCFGTDLNRNFPFQWCTVGASNDSCSDIFCGSSPGSEPETVVLTNYLNQSQATVNWWGYVTLHSYAQEWCIPWAYTATLAPDYDAMMAIGRKAVDALQAVYGTPYTLKIPTGRYGGFSMDWAKGVLGIRYPVLIELRDTGRFGFLLPAEQIIPTGEETLAAIVAYLREIIVQYNNA